MPLKRVGNVKDETSSSFSPSLSFSLHVSHVAPPISNNLPLFGFDDAKLEYDVECIWRV